MVERRTVVGYQADILRSLVQIRLEGVFLYPTIFHQVNIEQKSVYISLTSEVIVLLAGDAVVNPAITYPVSVISFHVQNACTVWWSDF